MSSAFILWICLVDVYGWALRRVSSAANLTVLDGAVAKLAWPVQKIKIYCCCHGLLCLLLCGWPVLENPCWAAINGLEEVGHSFQADMRGGTEVAVGDTALSQIRQPASVCIQTRIRMDSKLTTLFPRERWRGLMDSNLDTRVPPPNFAIGVAAPLSERVGAGLAVFSKTSWNSRFDSRFINFTTPTTVSASATNYGLQGNLGYKINDKWTVGAGPRIEIMKYSSSTVYGPGKLELPARWSVGGGFNLGALYKPVTAVQLGFGYRSPTWMGPNTAGLYQINNTNNPLTLPAQVSANRVVLPQRVMLGACYQPGEKYKIATELTWVNWRYSLFGNTKVSGPLSLSYPAGLRDIFIANIGTDIELTRNIGISLGYSYNTNPVRKQSVLPGFMPTNQHNLTYGLRFKTKRWWVGVAHIIGFPSSAYNNGGRTVPLGSDYYVSQVRQFIQSITTGIGCYF